MPKIVFIFLAFQLSFNTAKAVTIKLSGSDLSVDDVYRVSEQMFPVEIESNAKKKVDLFHNILLEAAKNNIVVYGLNRGVGLNKDKVIFSGSILDPEAKKASEDFNINDLRATATSFGENAAPEVIRAAMLIRLNKLLNGHGGVQPYVVELLEKFLNYNILPIVPKRGTVGEADIGILAHIGLALIGEGNVVYKGKILPASVVLQQLKIKPLKPYAKDALSIFSSNSFSMAQAILLLLKIEKLTDNYVSIFALSLEGLNGNIGPFTEGARNLSMTKGQINSSEKTLERLKNSYLYVPNFERPLQDPLSFRTEAHVNGSLRDTIIQLKAKLQQYINNSDDNPAVVEGDVPLNASLSEQQYYFNTKSIRGGVVPTANFEPLDWTMDLELLKLKLARLAQNSAQRIIHLGTYCSTKTTRFLAPSNKDIGFAVVQKSTLYLSTSIAQKSSSVTYLSSPLAGNIEDTATNSGLILEQIEGMLDDIYHLAGIELMHAAQAVELRKFDKKFKSNFSGLPEEKKDISIYSKDLLKKYRKSVPFLSIDRALSIDLEKSYEFVKGGLTNDIEPIT